MAETMITDLTDLRLWLIVLVWTAVGVAEKLAFYRVGQSSANADLSNVPGINQERRARLETYFHERGSYILLLASIPGIGAATSAVAGNVGVGMLTFVIWVTISNLIRNWLIIFLTGQIVTQF